MAHLLHILAHPDVVHSHTTRIAAAFLASYRATHPDAMVDVADLNAETVHFLSAASLAALGHVQTPESMVAAERDAWDEIARRIRQLQAADRYVVTAPMWNFGVPAILKAYFDQVIQSGHTFRFTGIGASVGLLVGRRAAIISTRGGIYSSGRMAAYEMCVRYIQQVLGFLGVEVIPPIVAEGLAIVGREEQQAIIQAACDEATEAALSF